MRTHTEHRACLLLIVALLTSSQAFAEEACPSLSPAYKVCFQNYGSFVTTRKDLIEQKMLNIDQYVPAYCFLERLESEQVDELNALDAIESVNPIDLEDIAPFLVAGVAAECSSHAEDPRCVPGKIGATSIPDELMFRFDSPAAAECFRHALLTENAPNAGLRRLFKLLKLVGPFDERDRPLTTDQLKFNVSQLKQRDKESLFLRLTGEELIRSQEELARSLSERGVVRIDPFEYATLRNGTTAGVIQSGDRYTKSLFERDLDGTGEVIGLIDGPLDTGHCFLNDPRGHLPGPQHRKLLGYRPSLSAAPSLHGTFVTGILAGESSKDPADPNNGQAPKAQISFDSVWDVASHGPIRSVLYQTLQAQYKDGARIFSNSWGDNERRWYTNWAYDIDHFTRVNERSLVLFAVHNDNDGVVIPVVAKLAWRGRSQAASSNVAL